MRLNLVDIIADRINHPADRIGGQLRAIPVGEQQLGTMQIETGRTAFIHFDMRLAVADHPAMRRHHAGQRQAIGSRSGGNPQHRTIAAEQIAKSIVEPGRQRIAIIGRVRLIRRAHGVPQKGMDRRCIVGQELLWTGCGAHDGTPLRTHTLSARRRFP